LLSFIDSSKYFSNKVNSNQSLLEGITIGNYLFERYLGKGSFANVWLGKHVKTGNEVAIKVISKASIKSKSEQTRFTREVSFLKQVDHPFISSLFEEFQNEEYHFLVMEYAPNNTLLNLVYCGGRISEPLAKLYFSQLLSALDYLHTKWRIVHRDIKLENILLDANNNIRLIDFGLSNEFTTENPYLNSPCGSIYYAAPELLEKKPYTILADIFSAGVALFVMVTQEIPFPKTNNLKIILNWIKNSNFCYPSYLSYNLVELLKKMLTYDPQKRISLEEIQNHSWISSSRCPIIFSNKFYSQDKYLLFPKEGIDMEIVDELTRIGVDCNGLSTLLSERSFSGPVVPYLILRKRKITNEMKDLLRNLENESEKKNCESTKNLAKPFFGCGKINFLNSFNNHIQNSKVTTKVYQKSLKRPMVIKKVSSIQKDFQSKYQFNN